MLFMSKKAPIPEVSPDMRQFGRVAVNVSIVSIAANALLSLMKLFAGFFSHSGAMISDAVHSASDVISSMVVIVGVRFSSKESDKEHPYGHERYECVAAIILAGILFASGVLIGYQAAMKLIEGDAAQSAVPGLFALIAAVVSITVKEAMYWFTRHYAKKYDSGALMADAWHHRSDALSSVGALIGIAGARMGAPILDTVASLVICAFIMKAAVDIFKDAVNKLVDHACSEETERAIASCAAAQDGVMEVGLLQTRMFGNRIYVDIEIVADASLSLQQAHSIAQRVHDAIEKQFPKVKHIMVHVDPGKTPESGVLETSEN